MESFQLQNWTLYKTK